MTALAGFVAMVVVSVVLLAAFVAVVVVTLRAFDADFAARSDAAAERLRTIVSRSLRSVT